MLIDLLRFGGRSVCGRRSDSVRRTGSARGGEKANPRRSVDESVYVLSAPSEAGPAVWLMVEVLFDGFFGQLGCVRERVGVVVLPKADVSSGALASAMVFRQVVRVEMAVRSRWASGWRSGSSGRTGS